MNIQERNGIQLNRSLTQRVIELHNDGYDQDFLMTGGQHLLCLQNNEDFLLRDVYIKVIDQAYDQLTKSFKYIHSIDTPNGEKGVLVTDTIYTNATGILN